MKMSLRLIDPAPAGVELPEYERLRVEHIELTARRAETERTLTAHQRAEDAAVIADRQAFAQAIRDGQPEPPQKATEAWMKREADLKRRLAAETAAVQATEADIERTLEQQRPAYLAASAVRVKEALADLAIAADAYIEAREELMAVEELGMFLAGRMAPRSRRRNRLTESLIARSGEPLTWQEVVDGIRADAAELDPNAEKPLFIREDVSKLLPR